MSKTTYSLSIDNDNDPIVVKDSTWWYATLENFISKDPVAVCTVLSQSDAKLRGRKFAGNVRYRISYSPFGFGDSAVCYYNYTLTGFTGTYEGIEWPGASRACLNGWKDGYRDELNKEAYCYIRQSDLNQTTCPAGITKNAQGKCEVKPTAKVTRNPVCDSASVLKNGLCVPKPKNGNCDQPD